MSSRVVYLILREDLLTELKWPLGAVFTQIAHASTACVWKYRADPDVLTYMEDLVDNESELRAEAKKLQEANVDHIVWVEDNMPVCVCVKPYLRTFIKPMLKHLPLYK